MIQLSGFDKETFRRVAIYSRVSTTDQNTENQTNLLNEIVERNGWDLVDTYIDEGISGSKGRDKRPEFDRLCKDMIRRKFEVVMVWDVSRLGRSLQHLVEFLNDVQSVGCDLYIHQQGLDTSTPSGRMMFQMVGVFSEFERSMISERVRLGLKRVKESGKKLGQPTKISEGLVQDIWSLKDLGLGLKQISSQVPVSRSTVYKILKMDRPHV
jgi:DNA invertase Pin-like site-specific DNA recombinase